MRAYRVSTMVRPRWVCIAMAAIGWRPFRIMRVYNVIFQKQISRDATVRFSKLEEKSRRDLATDRLSSWGSNVLCRKLQYVLRAEEGNPVLGRTR
jgi:hypothetical protein